jgi:iron uptake system EfeUOB component EfeO/EfeM
MRFFSAIAIMTTVVFFLFSCKDRDETVERNGEAAHDSTLTNGHSADGMIQGEVVDVSLTTTGGLEMPASLTAGDKTLRVTNNDDVERNFKISGPGISGDESEDLRAGETKTIKLNLNEGTYKVAAPVEGQPEGSAMMNVTVTPFGAPPATHGDTLGRASETPGGIGQPAPSGESAEQAAERSRETAERGANGAARNGTASSARKRASGAAQAAVVNIKLAEDSIELPASSVKAGKKTLKVTNSTQSKHNFKIEGNGVEKELASLNAGETKTVELDLQPGTYQLTRGMEKEFQVTAAEPGSAFESKPKTNGTQHPSTEAQREPGNMGAAPSPTGGASVAVRMTDSDIELPSSIKAGSTAFKVTNAGSAQHGFKIEGIGFNKQIDSNLSAGAAQTLQVDLKPGVYTVTCPVAAHDHGISHTLTVTP